VLRGLVTLISIGFFLLLVPARPPIIRAAIICSVFCLAYMARRPTNSINLLAFAALVLLLWRPLDLFSAGFQLSFVVVLALLLFVRPLYQRRLMAPSLDPAVTISTNQPYYDNLSLTWHYRAARAAGRYLWALFAVSLVAWLAGLCLAAWHFNRVSFVAPLASVALFPFICLTLFLGFAKLLLGRTTSRPPALQLHQYRLTPLMVHQPFLPPFRQRRLVCLSP